MEEVVEVVVHLDLVGWGAETGISFGELCGEISMINGADYGLVVEGGTSVFKTSKLSMSDKTCAI